MQWVLDSIPSLIAYVDVEQRYRLANTAYRQWVSPSAESVIGRTVEEVLGPAAYQVARPHIEGALAGRRAEFEHDLTDRDGRTRRIHLVLTPHQQDEDILGYSALATDITEHSRSERAVQRANVQLKRKHEEMEEFLSIIAHDLKQPVVGIQNLLSLLNVDCADRIDPASRKNLELSLAECDRMREMLGQLSELGRIGRTRPKTERMDLAVFVRQCVEYFQSRTDPNGPRFTVHAPDTEATFARSSVEEALRNLLDNAVKYGCTEHEKRIEVRCSPADTVCEISVTDHGPGIDPKHHARVFQLFRRMPRNEGAEGSGIGLAAVRRLMRRLDGDVYLRSEPGRGACFTLKFPLIPDR